jgi:hypothetical protein
MVSASLQKFRGHAAISVEEGNFVYASLERFKTINELHVGGPIEFTTWGDIDHMFQCTNHYTKDKSGNIDWSLEVEEGWIPHNIFSVHFLEEKKVIIHTCDPGPEFLNDNCSLCQGHFSPEGAITLGQCRHTFL